MIIFVSYPMHFDALKTIINSKNQKSYIKRSILLQNWSFPPKSGDHRLWADFDPFSANIFIICIFLIF